MVFRARDFTLDEVEVPSEERWDTDEETSEESESSEESKSFGDSDSSKKGAEECKFNIFMFYLQLGI